jgi:hypothetical protein
MAQVVTLANKLLDTIHMSSENPEGISSERKESFLIDDNKRLLTGRVW